MYPVRRRRSLAGPVILILIGLLFLMKTTFGMQIPLFTIFAKWWPVLLILAGLVKILESYQASNNGEPATRFGGGTVFLIVMLCIFGSASSVAFMHRNDVNWDEVRDEIKLDDDFMHMFGNTYTYDGEAQQVLPPNTSLKVLSDRGNVTLTPSDEPNLKVVWHKRVFAGSQGEADTTNGATNPQFSVAGTVVTLSANTQGNGPKSIATDVEIFAPKKLSVEVYGHRGDVQVSQREGDVHVELGRGDVNVDTLTGNLVADLRRGALHVVKVTGNVNITGRLQELTIDKSPELRR